MEHGSQIGRVAQAMLRLSAKTGGIVLNDTRHPSTREIFIGLALAFPLLVLAALVLDSIWD